jgi:electron transfer flavoprotein beta subunit
VHIVVVQRMVPDVVEKLELAPDGLSLDEESIRYIPNELDEHALEQALILKGRGDAKITVVTVGVEGADQAMAAAIAKGADEGMRLVCDFGRWRDNRRLASLLASALQEMEFDLVLTGVMAIDDLDGSLGGLLAGYLDLPYTGSVSKVTVEPDGSKAVVEKEYPGGLLGVMDVSLPAILGIGSAEEPPRYVPVSRVRQAMRSLTPEEIASAPEEEAGVSILEMTTPPVSRAEMVSGSPEEVADRLVTILMERGVL